MAYQAVSPNQHAHGGTKYSPATSPGSSPRHGQHRAPRRHAVAQDRHPQTRPPRGDERLLRPRRRIAGNAAVHHPAVSFHGGVRGVDSAVHRRGGGQFAAWTADGVLV